MLGGVLVDEQSCLASEDMGVASSQELSSMDFAPSSQPSSNVGATHSSVTDKFQNSQIFVNDLPVISHEKASNVCVVQLNHHEGSNHRLHLHSNYSLDGLPHTPSSLSTASTLPSVDVSSDTPKSEEKDAYVVEASVMEEERVRNSVGPSVSDTMDPSASVTPLPSSSISSLPLSGIPPSAALSSLATLTATATDDVLCGVCFGGECEEGNQILLCDGCDKGVHQACYGITIIPDGKWFCSLCEWEAKQVRSLSEDRLASHSKDKAARCKLCDHEGGIMRRGAEKVWVHSSCVLFASEGPSFRKKMELDDPCGITHSLKEARHHGYRCDLCTYGGFPLPCAYPQCFKRIHVTCAKEADCPCFLEHIWEGEGLQRRDSVWKAVFCREHRGSNDVSIAREAEKRRLLPLPPSTCIPPLSSVYNGNPLSLGFKDGHVSSFDALTSRRQPPRSPTTEGAHRKSPLCSPSIPTFAPTASATSTSPRHHEIKARGGCSSSGGGGCGTLGGDTAMTPSSPPRPLPEGNGGRPPLLGSFDPGGMIDAGTAAHTQIHAAPTRGVRVNWLRYENWFKRVAVGPLAEQIVTTFPLAARKTAMEEAKQIESILTYSVAPPTIHQLSLPPESDLALLEQITSSYETFLKPNSLVERGEGSTYMEFRVPPIAILDFGATAVWSQLKVSSVPVEVTLQEKEAANTFLGEWNRRDAAWDVLRSVNDLPPVEDPQEVLPVASLSPKRRLHPMERGLSQSSRDGLSLDEEEENAEEEEETRLQCFEGDTPSSSLSAYTRSTPPQHLSVRFGAFVKLSLFQMLYIRKKLATISVLPSTSLHPPLHVTCTFTEAVASPPPLSPHESLTASFRYHTLPSFTHASHTETPTVFLSGIHWRRPQDELMDAATVKALTSGPDDFVGAQLAMLVTYSRSCYSKLSSIRGNLLDMVLEENAAPLRVVEVGSRLQQQLMRYSAMSRWSHVCSTLVVGFTDKPESALPLPLKKMARGGETLSLNEEEASLSPPAKVEVEEDIHRVYCSFCFGEEGPALHHIFTCCRCQISVHKGCYAVGKPGEDTDASEWLCKRCEYEKKFLGTQWQITFTPGSVLCDICGVWGGAFKRTTTNTWVHLLCAVWLMPETHCEDLEQLEPWSLSTIQSWRRSSRCFFCGSEWGYCVICAHRSGGGRCPLTFHPMCAWLHGFKSIVQMDIRVHRCSNRDRKPEAYSHKDRRDKKKYSRGNRGSSGNLSAHLPPIEDESVCIEVADQYRKNMCAVCLLDEGMEEFNPMLHCSKCGLCVHRLCYGIGNACIPSPSQHIEAVDASKGIRPFQCDVCAGGQDPTLVYCRLCPRKGGALKVCARSEGFHRPPFTGGRFGCYPRKLLFAHMTCCLWAPNIEITDNDEMSPILGVETVPKLFRLCEVCGLSYGFSLECSQRGCTTFFHPLCAQLKGYFLEMSDDCITGFRSMAFCKKHSQIREKISPSVRLFLKLRAFLELAQIIVDQLRKRERIKHMWLRKRKEVLNREYPLLDEEELLGLSKENISGNADIYSCMLAKRVKHSEEKADRNSLLLKTFAASFDGNDAHLPNSSPSSSMESLASLLPMEDTAASETCPYGVAISENISFPSVSSLVALPGATPASLPTPSTSSATETMDSSLSAGEGTLLSSPSLPSTVVLATHSGMHVTPTLSSPLSTEASTTLSSALYPENLLQEEKILPAVAVNAFARPSLPVRKSRLFIPAWARRDDTRMRLADSRLRPVMPPVPMDTLSFPSVSLEKAPLNPGDAALTHSHFSSPKRKDGGVETLPPHLSSATIAGEIPSLGGSPHTLLGGNSYTFAMNSRKKVDNFLPTHLSEEELQALVIKTCQNLPEVSKRGRGRPSRKMKICWLLHSGNRAEAEHYARSSGRTFEEILTSVDSTKSFPRSSPDFHALGGMDDISPPCALARQGGTLSSNDATLLPLIARLETYDPAMQQPFLPSAALSSPIHEGEHDHPIPLGFLGEYSLPLAASLPAAACHPPKGALLTQESPVADIPLADQTKRRRSDSHAPPSSLQAASNGTLPFESPENTGFSDGIPLPHALPVSETNAKRQCTLPARTQAIENSSSYLSLETPMSFVTPSTRQCKESLSSLDAAVDDSHDYAMLQSLAPQTSSPLHPPTVPPLKISSSGTEFPTNTSEGSSLRLGEYLPLFTRISELQKLRPFEETGTPATTMSTVSTPLNGLSSMANEIAVTTASPPVAENIVTLLSGGNNTSPRASQKASSRLPKTTSVGDAKPPRKRQASQSLLEGQSVSHTSSDCSPSPVKRRNSSASAKSRSRKRATVGPIQACVVALRGTPLKGRSSTISSDASAVVNLAKEVVDASSPLTHSSEGTAEVMPADAATGGEHEAMPLEVAGMTSSSTQCLPDFPTDIAKVELVPESDDAHLCARFPEGSEPTSMSPSTSALLHPKYCHLEFFTMPPTEHCSLAVPGDAMDITISRSDSLSVDKKEELEHTTATEDV
ncbi:PHD-finger domain-containing protein [Cardiosporidium cionae]|uniref:PHD-finger domain-containing protein n=1 Tax=Cardiosporidium cionae TaxID=476202 RepID=A0ABQ7JB37_9APIC|nr:PHD-finger domain-containing protein [Cardiosporidium cionae]|eukprot:KAF8821199.1 PHD-finger domain-containing protein [Cardiosporidium cionae]